MTTEDRRPNVTISLVIEKASTLAQYRASEPDLDPEMLAVVDELIEKGRATLHPKWAAAAGAGAGEPDRGDGYPL
ncbi:MAG: hypothetical protein M3306_17175 [Actinomycetota bacterium]|nr:hypothetical protein [Actinomycetota bacterium]